MKSRPLAATPPLRKTDPLNLVFATYYELGRAAVAYSALEAGGFHPILAEHTHVSNAALYIYALGGLRVMLPENELESAREWMAFLKTKEIYLDEPIPRERLRTKIAGSVMSILLGFPLPIFLIPPIILLALWIILCLASVVLGVFQWFGITGFFYIGIVCHAKFIAGPKYLQP